MTTNKNRTRLGETAADDGKLSEKPLAADDLRDLIANAIAVEV